MSSIRHKLDNLQYISSDIINLVNWTLTKLQAKDFELLKDNVIFCNYAALIREMSSVTHIFSQVHYQDDSKFKNGSS